MTRADRPYQHPGLAFLQQYGSLQTEADLFHYVEFLRRSAGMSPTEGALPIDLSPIFAHFGMPVPLRVPLDDQQGILLDSETGVILIRAGDPIERQRFTEGHELMELLFDAQDQVNQELNLPPWDADRKEKLCDAGAAELLMPKYRFQKHLQHLGTSLETGRTLSRLYQTSWMATLIRMVQLTAGEHALIFWTAVSNAEGDRLRSDWSVVSPEWQKGFIPKSFFIPAHELIPNRRPNRKPNQILKGRSNRSLELDDFRFFGRIEVAQMNGRSFSGVITLLHG